jgi:hypothetical protein
MMEVEPFECAVKDHGQHYKLLFTQGYVLACGREDNVYQVNIPRLDASMWEDHVSVDAELTVQPEDSGETVHAVFRLFPVDLRDDVRKRVTETQSRSGPASKIQWLETVDACTKFSRRLDASIRASLHNGTSAFHSLRADLALHSPDADRSRRELNSSIISSATTTTTHSNKRHRATRTRISFAAKAWFSSLVDLANYLRGNLQRYNEDPCFPYDYLHHPQQPHLSGPIDGIIIRFSSVSNSSTANPPFQLSYLGKNLLRAMRSKHKSSAESLSEIPNHVEHSFNIAGMSPHLQTDRFYESRARVVKCKRVATIDLYVLGVTRPNVWNQPGVDPTAVRYILACNGSDYMQTSDRTVSHVVGIARAHPKIAAALYERIFVKRVWPVIVECYTNQEFIICNIRTDKTRSNHLPTVFDTMLRSARPTSWDTLLS